MGNNISRKIMNPNLKALFRGCLSFIKSPTWKKHLRYLHCQEVTGLSGSMVKIVPHLGGMLPLQPESLSSSHKIL